MKIYTLIGGVNGAGKSSLAGALRAERSDMGMMIDVDKLAARLGGQLAGGKKAIQLVEDCLSRSLSFTQETTLSGLRTERTLRRARAAGYHIRLYYVGLDTLEESLLRIQNRVLHGGHDIPQADVARRFATRREDILRALPYCDEAVFFKNDNGFVKVAEYRNAELLPAADAPDWVRALQAAMPGA